MEMWQMAGILVAVIVGLYALLGRRIDDLGNALGGRITDLRSDLGELRRDVGELRRDVGDLGKRIARIEGARDVATERADGAAETAGDR